MATGKKSMDRSAGIGGSDAPVVCGVARWKTPLQLWWEKVQALQGITAEKEENDLLLWGTLMEPKILQQFGKRTERKVFRPKSKTDPRFTIIHPDIEWLMAHLDGLQEDEQKGEGVVEAKNVSRYVSDRWEDEPPVEVQVQSQHYMAATGLEYATAVGLVGGHQLVWLDIERNQRFIDAMLEKEHDFWMRVLSDNPPTAIAADHKFLNTLVTPVKAKVVVFDGEAGALNQELQLVLNEIEKQKAVMDPLVKEKEKLEAQIKQMIGDAEEAHMPNGQVYTFKNVEVKEQHRKAYAFRKFVRKK